MDRPIPYPGEEPYVFISYSHRNSDRVVPIIHSLQNAGYRVWFDDGINPGSEWDENIAYHIKHCSYLFAFLSEEFLQSQNCRDELNFARDNNKQRLLVYLDEVTLPDGMAMRLNRLQAVHLNQYSSVEQTLSKISETMGIEVCRETSAPEKAPEQPAAFTASAPEPESGSRADPEPEAASHIPEYVSAVKDAFLKDQEETEKKKKKRKTIIIIVAIVLLIFILSRIKI